MLIVLLEMNYKPLVKFYIMNRNATFDIHIVCFGKKV